MGYPLTGKIPGGPERPFSKGPPLDCTATTNASYVGYSRLTISGEPWMVFIGILKLTGKRWRIFRAGSVWIIL
jgi:hypothetical protein